MSKIKILQVNGSSKYGGVSEVILNYSKNLSKEKFSIDYLSPEKTSFSNYEKYIKNELNGNIYELNVEFKGIKKYFSLLKKFRLFLKNNKYDIVHINSGMLLYNLEMAFISKTCGVKKIIIHSHNAIKHNGLKKIVYLIIKNFIPLVCTDYMACSLKAAKSMFPNRLIKKDKIVIINNAIDVNKFKLNESIRNKERESLKINNKIVYGHVGRFVEAKNHEFILKVFSEILKINKDSVLMLVGDGALFNDIKKQAQAMNIIENIIFCGYSKDTSKYYQIFDAFFLPSIYEGLPLVSIEAQTSGLPCFLSDSITKECKITDNIYFLSLKDSASEWAKKMVEVMKHYKRIDCSDLTTKNGFNIKEEISKIEDIYLARR